MSRCRPPEVVGELRRDVRDGVQVARCCGAPGWEAAARGGYIHSATPVPTKTFGPAIPTSTTMRFPSDSDSCAVVLAVPWCLAVWERQWWAAKAIGLDLAYQLVLYTRVRSAKPGSARQWTVGRPPPRRVAQSSSQLLRRRQRHGPSAGSLAGANPPSPISKLMLDRDVRRRRRQRSGRIVGITRVAKENACVCRDRASRSAGDPHEQARPPQRAGTGPPDCARRGVARVSGSRHLDARSSRDGARLLCRRGYEDPSSGRTDMDRHAIDDPS